MIAQNTPAVWRRASSLPVMRHPCRSLLLILASALCVFPALHAARAQTTNPPSPQYSTTPSLQHSSTPRSEYSTTPAFSVPVETNLPALAPAYLPEAMPAPPLTGTRQFYVPTVLPLPALPPLFRRGPLAVQPHLFYSLSYGDGLQAGAGQTSTSLINELDPGVLLRWGDHWSLDYTALTRFYSSSDFRNTFDNAVTLTGGTTYEDWTFGLAQTYASSSDPIIETGGQTDQQTFATLLSADFQMSSKSSLELGLNQSLRYADETTLGQPLNDYNSWSTMNWLNYQFWPRFGAALGAGFAYDNVEVGSDMTSEQIQGRVAWRVVDKLSLVLSGGAEVRQFLDSGSSDLISPLFSGSVQYSPFETTTLSIGAYTAVRPSYFQDQVTESTAISAGLRQRLLGKLFLDLNGGYANSSYQASTTDPASTVSDYDSTFFSARLSAPFLKRGTVSAFYSVNWNSSGSTFYDYTTTMVGGALSYRF